MTGSRHEKIGDIRAFQAKSAAGLNKLEATYRKYKDADIMPFARGTSFAEIAETVVPDKEGGWKNPVVLYLCRHKSNIGALPLCRKAKEYLTRCAEQTPLDILSVSAGMEEDSLALLLLIRPYGQLPNINNIYNYLDESIVEQKCGPRLIIPDDAKRQYTKEEKEEHEERVKTQNKILISSTEEKPFLNSLDTYTPRDMNDIDENHELIYDLRTADAQISTILKYEDFISIFRNCMRYVTTVERDYYYDVIKEKTPKKEFLNVIEAYIENNYINQQKMTVEDVPPLIKKINRALFELYIVQDLIDDPDITDIKITAPDSIRVRVKGKAYLSNITFIDRDDYLRFIQGIAVKNNVDLKVPSQTFTDEHDAQYILRFSITAPYITGSGDPIIHIRKVARKKLMAPDLIKVGMMDEKIRDYLLDCGKSSSGVVFAGPPGSGKTVMLNWFLEEAYESSAEILVIQENDELFAYRKGVMFEHVVNNPQKGEKACSLEELGQMALVAGANVFVIGEAKGAEICSAITLSNSGCRTAITIHSPSSTETIDKMADLAMRGYAASYDQAKRMIKSFQTVVYLENFQVQEISEIIGYDNDTKDMIYRPIYRRSLEKY